MKKKWIIASSVLLGIIVTIIILCFTVFTVKTVELDFRTSTKKEWNESQIVENSKIPFGKCILFMSKEGFLKNLEEKYPYLEVINIEKIFPSKMIIHVAEREELFAIEKDEKTIYLDKDFKVLNIEDESFVSEKTNAILLKNLKFKEEAQLSKFLKIDQIEMKRFYSSMLENNKTLNQICGFCKEISLEEEQNPLTNKTEVHMSIQTFSGRKIKILNISTNLSHKFQKMFQTLPMLYEKLCEQGDYTTEEVDRCEILIGNQITNESELYVHVYLDGEIVSSATKS